MQFTDIFRGKVVDVSKRSVTVEVTGTDDKIEAFEEMVRPFGLIEMVRTGEIAVSRGRSRHLTGGGPYPFGDDRPARARRRIALRARRRRRSSALARGVERARRLAPRPAAGPWPA